MANQGVNKSKLARELGVSRASLYYKPKREAIDEEVKKQIEAVMVDNPGYGHKRIAVQLKMGHNRVRRVMRKYGLKPYRRRARKPVKKRDKGRPESGYPNLIKGICPIMPGIIWVSDFTYIKYDGKFIYVATIIDLYTREVVGVEISRYHNRFLVMGAFINALEEHSAPKIIHSDQGSEYDSRDYVQLVHASGTQISMSAKGSPWQNGHQESFFGHFKKDSGELSRFDSSGELIAYIYEQINYYNNTRIHSKLNMAPSQFRKRIAV